MKYVREDYKIVPSYKATHKLIEDICDAGYLRTLDKGAYVRIGEKWLNFYGNWVDIIDEKGNHYSIRPNEVNIVTKELPQADTIEELFDEFVKVPVNEKPHLIFADAVVTYKSIITGDVQTNITPFEIYGAIWSDKGLIYVAKMNEKGEWVLYK